MFGKFQRENKLDTVDAVSYDFIWNDIKLGRSTYIEIFIKEYRIVTNEESTFYLHKSATAAPRNWSGEYLNDGSFKETVTELTDIQISTDHVSKLIEVANARKNADDLLEALTWVPCVDSQNEKSSLFGLAYLKKSNELLELIDSSSFQPGHAVKLMELAKAQKIAEDLQDQLNSLDFHQNLFTKNSTDSCYGSRL